MARRRQAKIALKVEDEAALMELRARAATAGLPSHIIVDAGRASGSVTCRFRKRGTESRSEYAMKWQSGALGAVQRLLLGPLLKLLFSIRNPCTDFSGGSG